MRILIALLALPVLLLLCILTVYRMPLPAALDGSRDLTAAVVAGFLGLGYLAGLLVFVLASLRRAGRALDPALFPLGFVPESTFSLQRGYAGQLDGRTVEIRYHPAYALQPATLDLTVRAQPGQRLAASTGLQRPLLDCRDCPRVEVSGLPGIQLYAADEAHARAWLAHPAVQPALLCALDGPGVRELYLQADRVWLRAHLRMPGDEIAAWMKDALPALAALAQTAETP
jgi:hypothetical protein